MARRAAADLAPCRPARRVSALWNSRLASLNGFRIGSTCSTPGMAASGSACSLVSSPMTPMMVRCSPRLTCGLEAQLADALEDVVDLLLSGFGFENENHRCSSCQ